MLEQKIVGSNVSICVKNSYMWRNISATAVTSNLSLQQIGIIQLHGMYTRTAGEGNTLSSNSLWQQLATQPTMSNICPVTDTKERLKE